MSKFIIFFIISILVVSFSQKPNNNELLGKWYFTVAKDTFKFNFTDTSHCSLTLQKGKIEKYNYTFNLNAKTKEALLTIHLSGNSEGYFQYYQLKRINADEYKILLRAFTPSTLSSSITVLSDSSNTGNLIRMKNK